MKSIGGGFFVDLISYLLSYVDLISYLLSNTPVSTLVSVDISILVHISSPTIRSNQRQVGPKWLQSVQT